MAKPYDATTKFLIDAEPRDLLAFAGIEAKDVTVIDAGLATVTADADKVIQVNTPKPFVAHLEFQAGPDMTLAERTLQYSVLLLRKHGLPVHSVIFLLRPEADSPQWTGILELRLPDGRPYLKFEYHVVRVWQKPVADVLAGGLGALPFAPISDVSEAELPDVIARMKERIEQEAAPDEAGELWTATGVLMGLRYPKEVWQPLLEGVRHMKESSFYQAVMQEGEEKGRREGRQEGRQEGEEIGRREEAIEFLLLFANKRLGPPLPHIQVRLENASVAELKAWAERLLDVESWDDLLS